MNNTLIKCLWIVAAWAVSSPLQAQGPGFSLSAGGNYTLIQAPNTLTQIPFSQFVNGKFKTYQVLAEQEFTFQQQPGAHLALGVQWRLTPSILIGTGIGLQYAAFALEPQFLGYRPVPGGSDTLFLPATTIQPTCDEIIFPDNFNPHTDPRFRHQMLHLTLPLELRLRPGKGQVEVAAGLWGALPAWTSVSKEVINIERRYRNNAAGQTLLDCVYSKGIARDNSSDGFRNMMWGLRGEVNYRFTPAFSLFAGYQYALSNVYDSNTKPDLPGRSIEGISPRMQVLQLGARLLWEEVSSKAPKVEPDPLPKHLNKATHQQMFKKKKKNAWRKKKARR